MHIILFLTHPITRALWAMEH